MGSAQRRAQWEFYAQGGAGCVFAALAAREPGRYGWIQKEARCEPWLIFPEVRTADQLVHLVNCLTETPKMEVEITPSGGFVCVGFRYLIHGVKSWISGFGDYDFLPRTRRAPMTEIAFRVKRRPAYDFVMKESPPDVIHLADLDMKGMSADRFKAAWHACFRATARLLGKAPDLTSAAKTTYSLPASLAKGMNLHG